MKQASLSMTCQSPPVLLIYYFQFLFPPSSLPSKIPRNLGLHHRPHKGPNARRLEPAVRHGRVLPEPLPRRPAARLLARLQHRLPLIHGEGALALRQQQLVVRRVAQDVQRASRVGLARAGVHDDVAAAAAADVVSAGGGHGECHGRSNRLERNGRREQAENGGVQQRGDNGEILFLRGENELAKGKVVERGTGFRGHTS